VPSAEAWTRIKQDCDAVWLPYPNPAGSMERLYRHHFPSKLPEYLALGMPVLVTGPGFATGVRWARANPGAIAWAGGDSVDEMADLLKQLAANPGLRRQLAVQGWEAGRRDFDPVSIRTRFQAHLAEAVEASGAAGAVGGGIP
jgi:glycosyltransferase involved in cell wall biosynthesis